MGTQIIEWNGQTLEIEVDEDPMLYSVTMSPIVRSRPARYWLDGVEISKNAADVFMETARQDRSTGPA